MVKHNSSLLRWLVESIFLCFRRMICFGYMIIFCINKRTYIRDIAV
jgi:hypothetical protein